MKLSNVLRAVRDDGVANVAKRVERAALPLRELRRLGALELVQDKHGLEIGGPSPAFGRMGACPVYLAPARIDNCNFAHSTVWEGDLVEGRNFNFHGRRCPGRQFIAEATDLGFAAAGAYDFVLSSHVIEHCADPIGALREWRRVLRADGLLVLIAPHRDAGFDHRRPLTSLAHLIADHENRTSEDDMTHLEEILRLHDLGRDPRAGGRDAFKSRALRNLQNRCLHHHVFDEDVARQMVSHAGFEILSVERPTPLDIVVLASKPAERQ